jgi:hypothetical protein
MEERDIRMSEYEILSKEIQIIDDYVEHAPIWYWGRHYDIIEAETPAKAKYKFYLEYLQDDDFVDGMAMIESCKLYKCPLCSGQPLPDDYTPEEYGDEPCQFCKDERENEQS